MQASEKIQFQELEQRELQRQERKRLENKRRLALKLEGKYGGSSGESSREPTPPIKSSILFPPLDSHGRGNRDVKLVQQKFNQNLIKIQSKCSHNSEKMQP